MHVFDILPERLQAKDAKKRVEPGDCRLWLTDLVTSGEHVRRIVD